MEEINPDKRIAKILQSMEGSKKASPRIDLFKEIEDRISNEDQKDYKIIEWRFYAAAAVVVLLMNTIVLTTYSNSNATIGKEFASMDDYDDTFLSTFQIYE